MENGLTCELQIIKAQNYEHSKPWHLKIKPSPNLPNDLAVRLYPSLCFFEATNVSIGRGTSFPFQVIGYPDKRFGDFSFVPKDIPGMQMNPVQEGKLCYGKDLRNDEGYPFFTLKYFLEIANKFDSKTDFITRRNWLNLLAGNAVFYEQIISGKNEDQIRKSWQNDLIRYKEIRKKYLLYIDFE